MTDNEYQLNPDERALVDELIANARALEQQAQGALRMVCKIRGLDGNWRYDNGKLIRQEGPI